MDFKDYYAALGVEPDASEKEIKRAYRKLAREHHPDVNPGDKQAEERFKEISEAYHALSDPERRRAYDETRERYQRWQQQGGGRDFGWGQAQPGAGERVYSSGISPEDLEDMFGDSGAFSDFFSSIYGDIGAGGRAREARPRRGRDIEAEAAITLDEAFHGAMRSIQIGERRIEARIPPGVRSGSRVRLSGQGHPGVAGGPAGDLYLLIEVEPHPQFERDGDDLTTDVAVDFYTAALGGSARVPTIDGSLMLKIPPRTQAGKTFRLRGKGMPRAGHADERGNLYARVRLTLPEPMGDAELDGLRALAQSRAGGSAQE